jgi:hypothetical protein
LFLAKKRRRRRRTPREVEVSGRVVLVCRSCGERTVLLGRPGDWHREGRETFGCECGREVTLADRVFGEVNLGVVAVPPLRVLA